MKRGYDRLYMIVNRGLRTRVLVSVTVLLGILVMQGGGALAQGSDLKPLFDRINRLERDIRTLNLQISRGEGAVVISSSEVSPGSPPGTSISAPAVARIESRLNNLEEDLRTATGVAEEVMFRVTRIGERLEKLISDVDYRLSVLESAMTSSGQSGTRPGSGQPPLVPDQQSTPAGTPVETAAPTVSATAQPGMLGTISQSDLARMARTGPQAPSSAPRTEPAAVPRAAVVTPILQGNTPKEKYLFARKFLLKNDFDSAEVAFRTFIDQHGDDPLVGNAYYWLGETFYVRELYVKAAKVFLNGYKVAPNGGKVPDTLLKLGMSLARLDKKKEACNAFAKLTGDFPKLSTAINKTLEREKRNNACE